ncbi:MAG: VanZ family protein [Candidatus Eisenbacteria sp.]|nr:VanZ family protein [Candidatus Eisenbacteria bacterium]
MKHCGIWAALALYIGLIFFLSSQPLVPTEDPFPHWDKVVHGVEYGILGYLSQRAARLRGRGGTGVRRWMCVGFVLLGGMGVAVADELLQSTVPGRVTSLWDLVADTVGLMGGLALNLSKRPVSCGRESGGAS